MIKEINFDMDGTLFNFYGVEGWLEYLENEDTTPYELALPLFNFSLLARYIHQLQHLGYKVNIISWGSKNATEEFNQRIAEAKMASLKKHLPSVRFDEIHIVEYGTPKSTYGNGILFDDEERNRNEWNWYANGIAFDVDNILEILKNLTKVA